MANSIKVPRGHQVIDPLLQFGKTHLLIKVNTQFSLYIPSDHITSSSFSPLFANIPNQNRAKILVNTMMEKFGGDDKYLCASFDPSDDRFNPKKYWRGPVWINMNWLLYNGLKNYGFLDVAERIKKDTVELISRDGFFEYFDCRKDNGEPARTGYGGNNFSWSAALLIDLLNTD
ncbi:MAG: hypothetical protein HKP53_03025 [Eudoraea sp.]|nr:hypothetical protein [Eudoraea sp.]